MKEPAEAAPPAPDTPVKVNLVVTESPTKDEPANAPPPSAFKRSMPTVPYSQCYTDVVSYGGVKNEAFTSISAGRSHPTGNFSAKRDGEHLRCT